MDTARLESTNADAWRGVDAVGESEEAAESEDAAWRRTAGSAKLTLPGIGSVLEAPHPIRAAKDRDRNDRDGQSPKLSNNCRNL